MAQRMTMLDSDVHQTLVLVAPIPHWFLEFALPRDNRVMLCQRRRLVELTAAI
jgi:hypothetical protein